MSTNLEHVPQLLNFRQGGLPSSVPQSFEVCQDRVRSLLKRSERFLDGACQSREPRVIGLEKSTGSIESLGDLAPCYLEVIIHTCPEAAKLPLDVAHLHIEEQSSLSEEIFLRVDMRMDVIGTVADLDVLKESLIELAPAVQDSLLENGHLIFDKGLFCGGQIDETRLACSMILLKLL